MNKIKTRPELVRSLMYEFQFDQPTVDATMSMVDYSILLKAVEYVRLNKPGDRQWLKAKIKEYQRHKTEPKPSDSYVSMDPAKYKELKKRLDERVKGII